MNLIPNHQGKNSIRSEVITNNSSITKITQQQKMSLLLLPIPQAVREDGQG